MEIETQAPMQPLPPGSARSSSVATETLALLTLALMGVLTLGWMVVFAWVNARSAGLI
jgi:hypothetical protein